MVPTDRQQPPARRRLLGRREQPVGRARRHAHHGPLRRVLGVLMLAILVGSALGYRHLTDPQRVRQAAERYLQSLIGGKVTVSSAEFSLFEGIRLSQVWISERTKVDQRKTPVAAEAADRGPGPTLPPASTTVFSCAELRLRHRLADVFLGRLTVDEIVAVRPILTVFRDTRTGLYNVRDLVASRSLTESQSDSIAPTVRLRNARIRIGRRDGDLSQIVEDLNLSILATPTRDQPTYELAWHGGGTTASRGRSRLDLTTMTITDLDGGLPWVSVEGVLLAADAGVQGAQQWCDLLGLTGQLHLRDFNLSADQRRTHERRATVELAGASLSVPLDEAEKALPLDQRYLRFNNVNGRLDLGARDAVASFSADLQGSACTLEARFVMPEGGASTLDGVGFNIDVTIDRYRLPRRGDPDLPQEDRLVNMWGRLAHFYDNYDPHGLVNLRLSVTKEPGSAPVALRDATVEALGCDASYRWFPYRVSNMNGTVTVTPDGVTLNDLRGYHGGGLVTVDGRLGDTSSHCSVDLRITGQGVPADGALHDAISTRYQRIWDQFDLAGSADIEVWLKRGTGRSGKAAPWHSVVDIGLLDASAMFSGFRYPVAGISGRLHVDAEGMTVTNLTGRAGDGRVRVDGSAQWEGGETSSLALDLSAKGIAFDERLSRAASDDARRLLERFDPRGAFDLQGTLTLDSEAGHLEHDLVVSMDEAQVTYRGMPLAVDNVAGRLHLTPERITVDRLTGSHGPASISAEGFFGAGSQPGPARLIVTCADLPLSDDLQAALPKQYRDAWGRFHFGGAVDTLTVLERNAGTGAGLRHQTTVTARDLSFRHDALPLAIDRVCGSVTLSEDQLRFGRLTGQLGDSTLTLEGAIVGEADSVTGNLAASVADLALTEDLRAALPWRLRRAWNNVRPTGTLDLDLPRLEFRHSRLTGETEWGFDSAVTCREAGWEAGAVVANLSGMVRGSGRLTLPGAGLSFLGTMALDSVEVGGRHVVNLTGTVERSASDRSLTLRDLDGRVYGGLLTGGLRVDQQATPGRYSCNATISDMQLRDYLRARASPEDAAAIETCGLVEAHVYLTGQMGDPAATRGGGRFRISEARLFRLPLVLSILEVLDLSVPDQPGTQSASAEFVVHGPEIAVHDLLLQSRTVALVGAGRMIRKPPELDLRLIAVSPHRWFTLPVLTELVEGASRELVEIRVRGPVGAPAITAAPLRSVGDAMETLLNTRRRPPAGSDDRR